jgi:ABC-2 type transport system permease protein
VVAVALVLVNILAIKYFARWDLTKRQLYTLSQGTRRIMQGLNDDLQITVFFTPNQPPPFAEDERFLRDQLDEYQSLARGHVHIRWVATDTDPTRREAEAAGCEKRPLQSVDTRQEQATLMEAYRCVTFEYLGRRDKVAFLSPGGAGLEYEISSIVRNLRWPDNRERTIGFLGGHGEQTPEEGLQFLTQLMEQERVSYRVRTINLNNGENPVPSDIRGLIIANPTRRIDERELRQIDAYLMRGGSVAVFASGVNMTTPEPFEASGSAAEHHLNDLLDGYGLHLDTNVVLDIRASDAVIRRGRGGARVRLVTGR